MSTRTAQIVAYLQQGQRLHAAGRLAEAEQIYRRIIAAAPNHADAIHMLGMLALQAGHPRPALELIDRAIGLKPSAAAYHVSRANALLALRQPDDAATACRTALRFRPNLAEAHQTLGHALTDSRRGEEAVAAYREALRLNPGLPDLHNSLGVALRYANRLEEAAVQLREAQRRAPGDPGVLANLSGVLKELGDFAGAETLLRDALRRHPANAVLRYNLGLLLLLTGRFDEGWSGFEARFQAGAVPVRGFPKPEWRGDALGSRTLLVYAEQGFGDMIQFSRFLPRNSPVVLEAPRAVTRLLSSLPNAPRIVAAGEALPAFDVVCPMMSLPVRRGMDITSAPPPYLAAEPDRVARWRSHLGPESFRPGGFGSSGFRPGGFKVGIAWQGNAARIEDTGRSFRLEQFLPLGRVPGVRLISLQKGFGTEQLGALPAGLVVETLGADFDSGPDAFLDSAAVIMNLDLVITSDTAIAHLAGALGRPVWVALKHVPDWRWMTGRQDSPQDSPWYPSMRLFRQERRDMWEPVFAEMAEVLRGMAGDGG
jgi:tetratricopeptide (TPR) repeat protein